MRWLRTYFVVLAFILFAPFANAGEDPIGWKQNGALPAQTIVNETYSGFTYTFISNLPFTMQTPLYIQVKHASDFTIVDNCSGLRLIPRQTCTVVIDGFVPHSPGTKKIQVDIEYGRNVVPLPEQSTTARILTPMVRGIVTTPLPATIGTGAPTPVAFEFINQGNGTVTGVSYTPNYPVGFVQNTNSCTSITTMAPGASCTVTGTLTAPTAGTYTVGATLNYFGGSTPLITSTVASVEVVASVSQALPPTTATGSIYPFQFTFTNTGSETVTGLMAPTVTVSGGNLVGPISYTCMSTLAAGAYCTVSGSFESMSPSTYTVTGSLTYNGGTVMASTMTTSSLQVTGAVTTPLPANPPGAGTGSDYPFVFTFTNNSTSTATGITVAMASSTGVGGIVSQSTTCPYAATPPNNSLAPGASCTISGTYTSANPGMATVTGTFTFAGGTVPPPPSTSTTFSQQVTGVATTPLPSSGMGAGSEYPFTFTFTNNADEPANDVSVASVAVTAGNGSIIGTPTNTCPTPAGSLPAGGNCYISGFFQPGTTTPSTITTNTITATFTYAGGTITPSPTTTGTSSQLVVPGQPVPLPTTIGTGSTYPFTFSFTNTASEAANGTPTAPPVAQTTGTGGMISTLTYTNCTDPLPAGAACTISGTFQTDNSGPQAITATYTYDGGTVMSVMNTTSSQMVTPSQPEPLPGTVGAGTTYPFEFAYTNNATQAANGVVVPNPTVTEGSGTISNIVFTNCTSPLAAGATCTVSGDFITNATSGAQQITSTFTYDGTPPVISSVMNATAAPLVTDTVTEPLPSPVVAGDNYTVEFTFNNTATQATAGTTAVTMSITGPATLTGVMNNCPTGPFPAGGTCTLTGTVTADANSPPNVVVTGTMTYNSGLVSVSNSTSEPAQQMVTVSPTTPLPNPFGAGSAYPIVFTVTNTDTQPATNISTATMAQTGPGSGTFTTGPGNTCGTTLGAGAQCTISGTFQDNNGGGPEDLITATFTYNGGTISAHTNGLPQVMVIASEPTPLPASPMVGTTYTFVYAFTNNATEAAQSVSTPTYSTGGTGPAGDFGTPSTTCTGPTLGAGQNCTVTNTLTPSAPGGFDYTYTATFNFAATPSPVATSTSGVSSLFPQSVGGAVTTPLPPSMGTGIATPFKFTFINHGKQAAGNVSTSIIAKPANGIVKLDKSADACGSEVKSLAKGASCTLSGTFTAPVTGDYSLDAVFNYDGKSFPISTKTNAGRMFTINNNCKDNVWFSFSGASAKNGCAKTEDCPTGSACVAKADSGKGVCYWMNPEPADHVLKLTAGGSAKVIVPDLNRTLTTLWSGSFAGRTNCEGKVCDSADCGNGSGACLPGVSFANPATQARFTLVRNDDDTYAVETLNGLNLGLSVEPANAVKSSKPNVCGTPGSMRKGEACSWQFTPPSADYVWVKSTHVKPVACTSDLSCAGGEVCGLSYDASQKPSFQRLCGIKQGYWTARQACALNAIEADAIFGCNNPFNETACTAVNGTQNCLNDTDTMTWLKKGCPTAITYPGDKASYSCYTPVAETNVTNYTITFCPA